MRILLTGATGFLGSHIAENLQDANHDLLLTKRQCSSLVNCDSFGSKLEWVNTDSFDWVQKAIQFEPDVIIHAAWNGVSSSNREDWKEQLTNLDFIYHLLKIAEKSQVKKFIALGSQAEYGQFEGKVDEDYPLNPTSSYGAVKLAAMTIIKMFCFEHNIDWYWLRVFSIFGERESQNWLLPSVISKMKSDCQEMDFTVGEQKYAYLYVKDFADSISKVLNRQGASGIYNLSSDKAISLKDLLLMVREKVNPNFKLNFGRIPYRLNQSMHIEGDTTKFNQTFGCIETSNFEEKLGLVINSFTKFQ